MGMIGMNLLLELIKYLLSFVLLMVSFAATG
jgi:uncharacterized membrane protein